MILRSKRPARVSALSSTSARLVAAITTTPSVPSKPSISVRIWLSVCSRSSFPPIDRVPPRARPMVSISSMKMIDGATLRASSKSWRTRWAPTPTIISMNSEALAEKKGTCASPAVARASRVLPVPGPPSRRTPLGTLAPSRVYFCGFCRKSTISLTSALTSSMPATSSKLTRTFSGSTGLAFLPPIPRPPSIPPPARRRIDRNIHTQKRTTRASGSSEMSRLDRAPRSSVTGLARTTAPWSVSSVSRSSWAKVGRSVENTV